MRKQMIHYMTIFAKIAKLSVVFQFLERQKNRTIVGSHPKKCELIRVIFLRFCKKKEQSLNHQLAEETLNLETA